MWYRIFIFLICCGCSIRPLHEVSYPEKNCGNIHVDMIVGRYGQMLYGYLVDSVRDLNLSNGKYRLTVTLFTKEIPYAFADDGNAQRMKTILTAKVILKNVENEIVLDTLVSVSATKNIASSQGDVLLSMYNSVNDLVMKNLSERIIENIKLKMTSENRI